MNIRNFSIKGLTITILIVIGLFAVLVSWLSGEHFFRYAREAQLYSLNRVIQVATREIMQELHDQVFDIATSLSLKGAIPDAFSIAAKNKKNIPSLVKTLDDPFITGFVGAYQIELVKVRVYDLNLNLLAESNNGIQDLPEKMPKVLYQQGHKRSGAERMKAIFGLWQHADQFYYSVLVPIGGLFISGYLEIAVNPVSNLIKLSEKMDTPVSIRSSIDLAKFYSKPERSVADLLPVEYTLKTELDEPAYVLTSYENIATLSEGVHETVFNSIFLFVGLVTIILLSGIWLFQLFLFNPINMMLREIKRITDGDISHNIAVKGLAEVANLADEFNKMVEEVRAREDRLVQLSVVDGLTHIANRRKFDEVLKEECQAAFRMQKPLTVLMIDIDYFKKYNDTYGHLAGDECLKQVAASLEKIICRPRDLVARYGGEEFAVILPDTHVNGEKVIVDKIMQTMDTLNIPHAGSPEYKKVTVSIGGYTVIPCSQDDSESIVAEADKQLYRAKEAGRNCARFNSLS